MKRFLPLVAGLLAFAPPLYSQTLQLKTGKVLSGANLRRDGTFVFLKVTGADGAPAEEVVPLAQIDRVEFGELPELAEARKLAREGNLLEVLDKTAALMATYRPFAEIPGSPWPEVMRLRLPAVAVSDSKELFGELQKAWVPTGDAELDTAYRLMGATESNPAGAKEARKALAVPGAGSLAAGLSWLVMGEEALQAKAWKEAIRAFLSVEVFLPHHPMLQPRALLGAAKAYQGSGQTAKAAALLDEIKADYPNSPQAAVAPSDLLQ